MEGWLPKAGKVVGDGEDVEMINVYKKVETMNKTQYLVAKQGDHSQYFNCKFKTTKRV